MPANKKYLTSSPFHRILKITAGFIGGYVIMELFFMIFIQVLPSAGAILTLQFAGFILWATLMILAFLAKNPYKLWGVYLAIIAILGFIVYSNLLA